MAQVITLRNTYNRSGAVSTPAYAVITNNNSDSIVSRGTDLFNYNTNAVSNLPAGITLKGLVNIGNYAYGVSENNLYRFFLVTFTNDATWNMTDSTYTSNFTYVNGTNVIQNANVTAPTGSYTFSEPLQINAGGTEINVTASSQSYTVGSVFGTTSYLATDGTNIYALLPDNRIAKITMSANAPQSITIVTTLPVPSTNQDQDNLSYGLTFQNNHLYTFTGSLNELTYVNTITGAQGTVTVTGGTDVITTAPGGSVAAYPYNGYNFLFISKYDGITSYCRIDTAQMNPSDPTKYDYLQQNVYSFQEAAINISITGAKLYTLSSYLNPYSSITYYNVYQLQIGVADIPICFLKGTYIYTNEGYKLIETLKKGDFVNTFKDNYVRIDTIVEEEIFHDAEKERNSRQLFKLSYPEYPQLLKDLYITGAHSILVGKLTEKQEKQIIKDYGRTFATDLFDRLPAYIDEKAKVHEESGTYTIYHLCLENENMYSNYGIFANGLLVESISKNDCVNRIY